MAHVHEVFAAHTAEIDAMFSRAQVAIGRSRERDRKPRRGYSKRGEMASPGEISLLPRLEILFVPNREPRIDWGVELAGSVRLVGGLRIRLARFMPEHPPNFRSVSRSFDWAGGQGADRTDYMDETLMTDVVRGACPPPKSNFCDKGTGRGTRKSDTRKQSGPSPAPPVFVRRSGIELTPKPQGGSTGHMWPVLWRGYKALGPWTHWESDAADGDREDRTSPHRDQALQRFCGGIWHQVNRRARASDGTDDAPPRKGPPAIGSVESIHKLPVPRRSKTAGNPGSRSVHAANEIALDSVADINRRGMHDPRSSLRSSWPYGPPPDVHSEEIRLAEAIVDSFLAERPWKRHRVQSNPKWSCRCRFECRSLCPFWTARLHARTSGSTAWRRPVEIEETRRSAPHLARDLWRVLEGVDLARHHQPNDLSRLWPRIQTLTDQQIDALLMKEYVGMTDSQIARHMGIARSGAGKHVNRGRRNAARFMWVAILLVVEGAEGENKFMEVS